MDIQEHRMQCLRMAFDLGGNPDAVISAAEKLLQFVAGPQSESTAIQVPALVEASPVTEAPIVEPAAGPVPQHAEADTSVAIVADPIAACGTVMTMAPSGDLADATPVSEPVSAVNENSIEPSIPAGSDAMALTANEAEASTTPETVQGDPAPSDADEAESIATEFEAAPVEEAAPNVEAEPCRQEAGQPTELMAEASSAADQEISEPDKSAPLPVQAEETLAASQSSSPL